MINKATLEVGGTDYGEVDTVSFSLAQKLNPLTGEVVGGIEGGYISFTAQIDKDTDLLAWMHDASGKKNGSFKFIGNDNKNVKELKFESGYMANYSESFTRGTEAPQMVACTISAQKITLGEVTLDKGWDKVK